MKPLDEGLKRYASPRQSEFLEAVNKYGGFRPAARVLGVSDGTIRVTIKRLVAKAASRGYAPEHGMTRPVPDTFQVSKVSTYYGRDGKVGGQWVQAKPDAEQLEAARQAALEAMTAELPRLEPIAPPDDVFAHLLNLYTFTDYHLGMLAWGKETGADWNIEIAERLLFSVFRHMLVSAPAARTALLNIQGDFLHFDSLLPVTPTHGHVLDAAGKLSEIIAAAIRVLRRMIDLALRTHEEVYVVFAEGNHDLVSSLWLRHMFKALYEREPRLFVDDSELPYYVHQHGVVMLGMHHGHLAKNESLPLLFAARYPVVWGATRKRYIHTGHRHHVDEKEFPGVKVIQHPTLAAPDSHSARHAYLSEQEASCMTYDDRFGCVGRAVVTPEMFSEAA
jgi:hypothetical protein